MTASLTDSHLKVDSDVTNLPDLTGMLKLVRIATSNPLSVVYRYLYADTTEVAVKVIIFPSSFNPKKKEELTQKARHELHVWRTLNHPNIVPLLGTACSEHFGSEFPCLVSPWMENGTLFEYTKRPLQFPDRIRLIVGIATALEYLHSQGIVHGDIYPGSILIDGDQQPRLTDFGLSTILDQGSDRYPVYPGVVLWAAPELLYPELYPKLEFKATLPNDIYSIGSIIFFIVSGQYPWRERGVAENNLKQFQNPSRPTPPANIPDGVWGFIERCWSPRDPRGRPSAQEVLAFSVNALE